MKLFYYENFFFYLNMITIFCKLIFTKKKGGESWKIVWFNYLRMHRYFSKDRSNSREYANIALCIDRIEIYCKLNRHGINHKRLRRFMVCRSKESRLPTTFPMDLHAIHIVKSCYLFHAIDRRNTPGSDIKAG